MSVRRVALLTAGGFAPCLSSAVGGLIQRYTEVAPDIEIIAYQHGYQGLLKGDKIVVDPETRAKAAPAARLRRQPDRQLPREAHERRGLRQARAGPGGPGPAAGRGRPARRRRRRRAAHDRWRRHEHRGRRPRRLPARNDYDLQVVGLPKTIDNDVIPIKQSLGAWTAADEGAGFSWNVVSEHSVQPAHAHRARGHGPQLRMADRGRGRRATASWLDAQEWLPDFGAPRERRDVHAVFVPEMALDIDAEAARLKHVMDEHGQRQHLPVRGCRHGRDRRPDGGRRRGGPARRLRARASSTRSTRPVVRQAVRADDRRREGPDPEVRLLLARGGRERRGPARSSSR